MLRASRAPSTLATSIPIRTLPVALTTGTFGEALSTSPTSRPPITSWLRPSGATPGCSASNSRTARANSASQAIAVSGVFSEGFQTTGSSHTSASAVFQDHTATGKLKAEITPHTPSGCQVSIMRWPGRSEAMVKP